MNKVFNTNKLTRLSLLFLVLIMIMVYANNSKDEQKQAEEISKFHGKTWVTIGDSITYQNGYQPLVNQTFKFGKVKNYGKSRYTTERLVNDIGTWDNDASLVTFFAGTNDFGQNVDLDVTKRSVNHIFKKLKEKYPKSDIVVMLPLQRWGFKGDPVPEPTMINSKGITLKQYNRVIEETAKKYKLPTINLYEKSGITKDTISLYTKDGLHPNEMGYEKIASVMTDFIKHLNK